MLDSLYVLFQLKLTLKTYKLSILSMPDDR